VLKNICDFCPPGTQIKSPGGVSFDPSQLVAVVATETYGEGLLELHTPGGVIKFEFYRNVGGGPADVYAIHRAIVEAGNAGKGEI